MLNISQPYRKSVREQIMHYKLVGAYFKLEESLLFERQIESCSNQLNIMMHSEEKVRAFRHDMKHHLNELSILANRLTDDNIINYIQSMYISLDNPCECFSSGNKEVDSLISYMLNKAKHILEKVKYEINVPKKLEISSFDLNVIIAN